MHAHQVVAREFRPSSFEELVGQNQVVTALGNAIRHDKVGHAYLFTGARGVGKTSAARIFAKCLNCSEGPTPTPCGKCETCLAVADGDDVDVIEIDGASNRGIDEIRQLRSNANIRPSRAPFKIYIIDEVHMLTLPAFNALLKTLEEPPSHVKFIFCTTDPEKIPITVLSRCQRFDFPPIQTESIRDRLRLIVDTKSVEADDDALELLARRANGSMRDSQSLLEQLLSWSEGRITLQDIHALLGTADNSLVIDVVAQVASNDAGEALKTVAGAIAQGVDPGQFTEQLLGMLRDVMALRVGCESNLLLYASADDQARLKTIADSLGVDGILAMIQVFDQTLTRLRHSSWARTLLEAAIVRCCHLSNLDLIPKLIDKLQSGERVSVSSETPTPRKKKHDGYQHSVDKAPVDAPTNTDLASDPLARPPGAPPKVPARDAEAPVTEVSGNGQSDPSVGSPETGNVASAPSPSGPQPPTDTPFALTDEQAQAAWARCLDEFNDLTAEAAGNFESIRCAENRFIVTLKTAYDEEICNRTEPRQRLQGALRKACSADSLKLVFEVTDKPETSSTPKPKVMMTARQRIRQMEQNEFVRAAMELFEGEITGVR